MAEGLFRRLLGNRKDIEIASAGVHAVRGQPPSLHAIHVCEQEGVDIRGVRSQPLTATLVDRASHIFARSILWDSSEAFAPPATIRGLRGASA